MLISISLVKVASESGDSLSIYQWNYVTYRFDFYSSGKNPVYYPTDISQCFAMRIDGSRDEGA